MGSLAGKSPKDTYKSLLKVTDETNGVTSSVSVIQDGNGSDTCLSVSERNLKINPSVNNITTFEVENSSGNNLLTVDTSNSVVKLGSTQTPANSKILEFNVKNLAPTAGMQ